MRTIAFFALLAASASAPPVQAQAPERVGRLEVRPAQSPDPSAWRRATLKGVQSDSVQILFSEGPRTYAVDDAHFRVTTGSHWGEGAAIGVAAGIALGAAWAFLAYEPVYSHEECTWADTYDPYPGYRCYSVVPEEISSRPLEMVAGGSVGALVGALAGAALGSVMPKWAVVDVRQLAVGPDGLTVAIGR